MIKEVTAEEVQKRSISIKIDFNTIEYFKEKSNELGIPYQKLINIYLNNYIKDNSIKE